MIDHDSPEKVAERASQEDPIVMYLVVRESLGMSPGKLGPQCGHAAGMAILHYKDWQIDKLYSSYKGEMPDYSVVSLDEAAMFERWLQTSYRKVSLRADDNEWEKVKTLDTRKFVVRDAGLTEVAAGSETVIALWPMLKSARPRLIKRLRAL